MFNTGLLKVGRRLYVTTANKTVAFDAATCDLRGQYVSAHAAGSGISRDAGYSDGKIFRGTLDGRDRARREDRAVTMADAGREPCKQRVLCRGTHRLASESIYWHHCQRFRHCRTTDAFDANTGKELWRFQTTLPGSDGQPTSPAVASGTPLRWIRRTCCIISRPSRSSNGHSIPVSARVANLRHPPISHDALIEAFKRWITEGRPCPRS
jgi:outer membrane protein assembly factor BamB